MALDRIEALKQSKRPVHSVPSTASQPNFEKDCDISKGIKDIKLESKFSSSGQSLVPSVGILSPTLRSVMFTNQVLTFLRTSIINGQYMYVLISESILLFKQFLILLLIS